MSRFSLRLTHKITAIGVIGLVGDHLRLGVAGGLALSAALVPSLKRKMRGARPFIFTNLKKDLGVAEIANFIITAGGLPPR